MTIASRLRPKVREKGAPASPAPRCESKVWLMGDHDVQWRKRRYGEEDFDRCTFPATVNIDEKFYCNRHGGEIALAKLLGED